MERIRFRYIVLIVLAIMAACRFWLYPIWDQQLRDIYEQQKAYAKVHHDQ